MSKMRNQGKSNKGHPSQGSLQDLEQNRGQAQGEQRGKTQNWDRGQGSQNTQGGRGSASQSPTGGPDKDLSQRGSPNRRTM